MARIIKVIRAVVVKLKISRRFEASFILSSFPNEDVMNCPIPLMNSFPEPDELREELRKGEIPNSRNEYGESGSVKSIFS